MQRYSFFNLPVEYSKDDYKETINGIVKKYSRIDNLIAVYNWGSPSTLGISDIDLVFVFRQKAKPIPFLKRSFYFLNAKTRYLVRHPFMFIGENSFKDIKYVYPKTKLKIVHGNNIAIKNLSKNDDYYAKIALLNDIIIRHYPRDFLEQSVSGRINVRDTLLRLNSLRYTVEILEELAKEKNKEWIYTLSKIKKLRENWFNDKDFESLISLNNNAVKMTMDIIQKFRSFLTKNRIIEITTQDNMQYNGLKNMSVFLKEWNKDYVLDEVSKAIKNQKFRSILPIELVPQLIEYSKYDGLISSYIRSNIIGDIDYRLKHEKTIEKRIYVLNSQAELASKLKHSDFPAFFDFGYRQKIGINNWLLNAVDKIRFSS